MDKKDTMTKLLRGGDDFFLKVPRKIIEEKGFEENDYVLLNLEKVESYIIEVDKPVLDELERLKKLPQYAEKDDGEILKEIMLKFHAKENKEENKGLSKREIVVVEKGSLE